MTIILSIFLVAVPMAGTVEANAGEAGNWCEVSIEAARNDTGISKDSGTGISKTLCLKSNFHIGQIHEWVYDNTFQAPSIDNFCLSDPLISPYEDWSASTWHRLVSEDGSYAQAYGDPVWPARMTGVDLSTFCWTSHFNDPDGDFSFDVAIVTSTGDIVNTIFHCAYSKTEDAWTISSNTYEGSGLEVQPLMETFVGPDEFYTSIQEGIDNVAEGGTVNVATGTYDEQIVTNKSLTLQGEGATTTTIQAPDTMTETTWQHNGKSFYAVIEVNGASAHSITVDINGFTVDGLNYASASPRSTGIVYHNADGTVSSNTITNFGHDPVDGEDGWGIWVVGGSAVTIEENTVNHYAKGGIVVNDADSTGSVSATVAGNTVTGAGATDASAQNGIEITYGATGTITGNTISNIAFTDTTGYVAAGILVWNSSDVTITGNTITDCQKGVAAQTNEAGSHAVTIENNIISSAGLSASAQYPAGISVAAWNPGTITATIDNNDLTGGGPNDGIDFYGDVGTVNATVTNNEISGWTWSGIWIDKATNTGTITGNTITNNGVADSDGGGIDIYSDADVTNFTIHNNDIVGNADYGIHNASTTGGNLDATNNWWGDASGPTHASNPGGTGDKVSDNVNFIPFLSPNVTITKTGPTTANKGNNITYTITYKNVGTFSATNVVITETYPSEVEYLSATPAPSEGNNIWNIGDLASDGGGTIKVTVHIK